MVADAHPPPKDITVPARFQRYINVAARLDAGQPIELGLAHAEVRVDPVDKATGTRIEDRAGTARELLADVVRQARHEVFAMTPYFVLGKLGMQTVRAIRERGVEVTVLTNSLAATDEPAVHNGYLRYRKPLLEIGVQLYELSPELARTSNRLGRFGRSLGMLHAKVIVIDRRYMFVGSLNIDGRSERYNTEVGVVIDSPTLAGDLLDFVVFDTSTYRVRLSADREKLHWIKGNGGTEEVFDSEPEASLWRLFRAHVLGALLPEDWL